MSGSNSSAPGAKPAALDQPLGLTVHSLPSPQEAVAADARRTASGRWKMLLVALVCAAPVLASYYFYYVVRPQARTAASSPCSAARWCTAWPEASPPPTT